MIIELHERTFYWRTTILLTLCALAGCESFLVSICELEVRATCTADSSSNTDLAQRTDDSDEPAITIQERKFDRRASFPIYITRCQKFNGIIDRKILTLVKTNCTTSAAWEAWDIDLNNSSMKYFNLTGIMGYPSIPSGFAFSQDEIYAAGGKFYYIQHSGVQQLFELKGAIKEQIMTAKLTNSSRPRAFAHPSLDVLAVPIEPIPTYNHPTFVYSGGIRYLFDSSSTPTSFVVGDLDGNDPKSNGEEVIAFEGKVPTTVSHWNLGQALSTTDQDLLTSIKQSIDRANPGDPSAVETAFITNLNKDAFPDLIYIRNGQIYVTSYLGKDKNTESRFKNWTAAVGAISGEKVKSLVAVELTNDAYPELVVETEDAVHFYVNNP